MSSSRERKRFEPRRLSLEISIMLFVIHFRLFITHFLMHYVRRQSSLYFVVVRSVENIKIRVLNDLFSLRERENTRKGAIQCRIDGKGHFRFSFFNQFYKEIGPLHHILIHSLAQGVYPKIRDILPGRILSDPSRCPNWPAFLI